MVSGIEYVLLVDDHKGKVLSGVQQLVFEPDTSPSKRLNGKCLGV